MAVPLLLLRLLLDIFRGVLSIRKNERNLLKTQHTHTLARTCIEERDVEMNNKLWLRCCACMQERQGEKGRGPGLCLYDSEIASSTQNQ